MQFSEAESEGIESDDITSEDEGAVDNDPYVYSSSNEEEDMSLSEDEEGNIVPTKQVAKRGTTRTRSKAKVAAPVKAAKPAAARRAARKPAARQTRAKPQVVPTLIRKHDVGVFLDTSDEDEDENVSQTTAVDFRHLTLKEDHGYRYELILFAALLYSTWYFV